MITRNPSEFSDFTDCGHANVDYSLLNDVDSYKDSHPDVYPPGLTAMQSYVEDRAGAKFPASLVFGLQYTLKRRLAGRVISRSDIEEEAERMAWHGEPFPRERWLHVVKAHGGRLPIRIRAVPEGSLVPVGNALRTIEATCPACAWLPSNIETNTLRDWAPRAVATQGFFIKTMIAEGLAKSSDDPEAALPYALHDFGSRGVTCPEQAGLCGMAHLVNFRGTDTKIALRYAETFYGAGQNFAHSVPALEHSNIMSWTDSRASLAEKLAAQEACFASAMRQWAQRGHALASYIADTFDVRHTITQQFCGSLLPLIKDLHGSCGLRVVVRLDSGNPISEMVVRALNDFKAALGVTGGPKTGFYQNKKGYLVLPDFFRILQGDGVSIETVGDIDRAVMAAGYSTECISTRGMGGKNLHSGVNRDTQRTAQKPSIACVNRVWHDVAKNPVDDPGKRSKGGWLDLIKNDRGEFETVNVEPGTSHPRSELVTVFEDGTVTAEWTLDEVRARAEAAFRASRPYYPFAGL